MTKRHSEVGRRVATYLSHRPEVAAALPSPDETWTFREIEIDREAHAKLTKHDAIESVELNRSNESGQRIHTWRTCRDTYDFIQRVVLPADQLGPCGHSGVHTIKAGETYTCCHDDCDETFGRQTAQDMLKR